jgi:hypothetical protein
MLASGCEIMFGMALNINRAEDKRKKQEDDMKVHVFYRHLEPTLSMNKPTWIMN